MRSLEALVGGRWFHFIGVVALLFGAAYLLKYGYDEGWFSPALQVGVGLVVGLVALAGGHVLSRRDYPVLAAGAWGGGVALLHLVLFAAYRVYDLVPREIAFAGMVLTTVAAVALAVTHRSLATAVLAAVGAYVTPALLGGLWAEPGFLWTYLVILTAGFLTVCALRSWAILRPVAFVAVTIHMALWWLTVGPGDRVTTVAAISAFLVLFVLEPVIADWRRRLAVPLLANVVVLPAAALHLIGVLTALSAEHDAWRGVVVLGTGLFLLTCTAALIASNAPTRGLRSLLGCSGAVLVLAFPLAEASVTGHEVTLTWAVTAVLFTSAQMLCGRALGGRALGGRALGGRALARRWSLAALLLAGLRLLAIDAPDAFLDPPHWQPLFTVRGLTFAVVAAAFTCVLYVRARRRPDSPDGEQPAPDRAAAGERFAVTLAWVVAVSLPVVFLSLEVRSAFEAWVKPLFAGRRAEFEHGRAMWFALMWVAYAGLLLIVGRRRDARLFRVLGGAFGAFVLTKLVLVDLAAAYIAAPDPIANARFTALAGIVVVAWLVRREFVREGAPSASLVAPVCTVLAHVFLLGAVSMEWHDALAGHDAAGFLIGARWIGPPLFACLHGLALVRLAGRHGGREVPTLGVALSLLGGVAWLLLDPGLSVTHTATLIVSLRGLAGTACVVCLLAGARVAASGPHVEAPGVARLLGVVGHVTAISVLGLEVRDLLARHAADWSAASTISVVAALPALLAAAWAAYGAATHLLGTRRGSAFDSNAGLTVLAVALACAAVAIVTGDAAQHVAQNTRFLGCGVVAAAMFVVAEMHRRRLRRLGDGDTASAAALRPVVTAIVLVAHALVIALLSREALDHFATLPSAAQENAWLDRDSARQLALSSIWALYGIAMVVAGFVRRFQPVRVMALALLALTVLKVFVFDLSFLETVYRVLSFMVLGAALVGVSYFYQRHAVHGDAPPGDV